MSNTTGPQGAIATAEDHSSDVLPESEVKSTTNITLVRMGYTVSATDLLFGMSLGLYFSFWTALLVAFLASLIISATAILMGLIGFRERLTTALIARLSFGRNGARIPQLIIAIISVGFVGYSIAITTQVMPGSSPSTWPIYIVVLTAIYTYLCNTGFSKGLTWAGRISVPLTTVISIIAGAAALRHAGGWEAILNAEPAMRNTVGAVTMAGLGAAAWIQGATVSPDITRFCKNKRAVWTSTILQFQVGDVGFNLIGIILGLAAGTADMGVAFDTVGVGLLVAAAIFIQGFPHETNNLYAGSLAARSALDIPRLYVNIISGILAAALAYWGLTQGLLDSFLKYLGYLSYAMPLIPGIIIADYYLIKRGSYTRRVADAESVNWDAVIAFGGGIMLNLILAFVFDDTFFYTLPILGAVLYCGFAWRRRTNPAVAY